MSDHPHMGDILRQERESRQLTYTAIQKALYLRPAYIQAIETMDLSQLPSQSVALGMIRQYARFLNLDEKGIAEEFRVLFEKNLKPSPLKPSIPLPSQLSSGLTIRLLPFLLGGSFLAYLYVHPMIPRTVWNEAPTIPTHFLEILKKEQSETTPSLPLEITIQTTLQDAANPPPTVSPILPPLPQETVALAKSLDQLAPPPSEAEDPASDEVFPPVPPRADRFMTQTSPSSIASPSSGALPTPASADPAATPLPTDPVVIPPPKGKVYGDKASNYFIQANSGATWLEIRDPKRRMIFGKILRKGERYAIPDIQGLTMKLGYAKGVDIYRDGQILNLYDKSKTVVSDIPLTPSSDTSR